MQMKISNGLTIGGQPTVEDLSSIKAAGFATVINLRAAGESDQPLSPDDEAAAARELGLEYIHAPLTMQTMNADRIDEIRAQLASAEGPVFMHCHAGTRAGAVAMMDTAARAGMTGEQCLAKAHEMGFACDKPQIAEFVSGYVDSQLS